MTLPQNKTDKQILTEEIHTILQQFNRDNPDPSQRPYITLTSPQMKEVKVYLHWLSRAELRSNSRDTHTVFQSSQSKIKVRETRDQITYLIRCKLGLCEYDNIIFNLIRENKEEAVKQSTTLNLGYPLNYPISTQPIEFTITGAPDDELF